MTSTITGHWPLIVTNGANYPYAWPLINSKPIIKKDNPTLGMIVRSNWNGVPAQQRFKLIAFAFWLTFPLVAPCYRELQVQGGESSQIAHTVAVVVRFTLLYCVSL